MKDTANCPYCQSEERGCSEIWAMNDEGWEELKRIHDTEHFELQKAFDALPDGTKIILPGGWFRLAGECRMKPHQMLEGSNDSFLGGIEEGNENL